MVEMRQMPHMRVGRKILFDIKRLEGFINENSFEPVENWSEKLGLK